MTAPLSIEQLLATGLEMETAIDALPQLDRWLTSLSMVEGWQQLTRHWLKPDHPFALHQLLYETTFRDWDWHQGPAPAWFPTAAQIQATHLADLMRSLHLATYADLHAWSVQQRSTFWQIMIERLGIRFHQPYRAIVDLSQGVESPQWLVDARLNIAESCFQAAAAATAILWQPEGGPLVSWSYGELNALSNRVANGLVNLDVQPGTAIAIAMPMTPAAVAIYLGIVKAGAVVVSIADSFAATEMAARLRIAAATMIFTQDVIERGGKILPLYTRVVEANAPLAIVLSQGTELAVERRSDDRTWAEFLSDNPDFTAIPVPPAAHTNILFSSGTTGEPKAIPWTHTTPIKCATDAHLHHNIHPGDVLSWPTNLGWMMGPWLIYASLINQGTIALYGGVPSDRGYGQFIEQARVTLLGVVPSLVSAWKTSDCMRGLDWSAIRVFSSTGECSNPQDMLFLMALAGYKPILEYCGGTEIGGAYITGTLLQPAAPATCTTPTLGLDFVILDDQGHPHPKGEAFLISPSIGLSTELLNRDHHTIYFAHTPPGPNGFLLRCHGDHIERFPNGYYRIHGRVDDTMNLSGIKISATEIERVLHQVEMVQEAAAIAVSPIEGGPSQLIIYAVVKSPSQTHQTTVDILKSALQTAIRQSLNPLFKIHDVILVDALPRTASNKVMRRVLRDRYGLDSSSKG